MTSQAQRAQVARWGTPIFRLALLLTGERSAAEEATATAFAQTRDVPAAELESALYAALIRQYRPHRRQLPHWLRRSRSAALSGILLRLDPLDRLLLALWLLQGVHGEQLATLANSSLGGLATRFATIFKRFLDADDPIQTEPGAVEAFIAWLEQQLGPGKLSVDPAASHERLNTRIEWQATVDELRQLLRRAVERHHLPLPVVDTLIAETMTEPTAETSAWWQQRYAWIGAIVVSVGVLLFLLVRPGSDALTSASQGASADEIVQQVLDTWNTEPISGTVHRRVWAVDRQSQQPAASTTDVWMAGGSAAHRVEVRRDKRLVEWQIGNGTNRLDYAADPRFIGCRWGPGIGLFERQALTFTTTQVQQTAAREIRLTQGGYGVGYEALQAALTADDLRSFGTRIEDKTALLTLGYTNQRTSPPSQMLLRIDPLTKELQNVQQLALGGGQATAKDIWRLELVEQVVGGVSLVKPQWPGVVQVRDRVFDLGCLALHPNRIVSLRRMVNMPWGWQLPKTMPPNTTAAAIISSSASSDLVGVDSGTRAIFIGPGRWLSIGNYFQSALPANSEQHGVWSVSLNENADSVFGIACQNLDDQNRCAPSLAFAARGWTRTELLALVDTLRPVDTQLWRTLDNAFLDSQPLPSLVQQTLMQSLAELDAQGDKLYIATEERMRTEPSQPVWNDPYYVPEAELFPPVSLQEEWIISDSNGLRYKQQRTTPDKILLSVETRNGDRVERYDRGIGSAYIWNEQPNAWWYGVEQSTAERMITSLLSYAQPITLTDQGDTLLLEQLTLVPGANSALRPPFPWIDDLLFGQYWQRLWLSQTTKLPQRLELVHVDEAGRETMLQSRTITALQQLATLPPANFFALPSLPDEVLRFENGVIQLTPATRSVLEPQPLSRALMWPAGSGPVVQEDQNTADASLSLHIGTDFNPGQIPLKATTYQMPPGDWRVTIRQGPRDLLRYMLRYNRPLPGFLPDTRIDSKAVPVTIAGEQRTAWLLRNTRSTVLVVEVDEVLLHITSPDTGYLEGTIAERLAKLEWVQLDDQ